MAVVQPVVENRQQLRPVARNPVQAADYDSGQIVGRAAAQGGAVLANFAEEQNRVDIALSEAAARDADNAATAERAKLYHDGEQAFFNQQGRNALNAVEPLQQERQRIDREALARLNGNDLAQRMYRDVAARRQAADNERIYRHVSTERTRYENGVDEEAMTTAIDQAVLNANEPAEITRNLATLDSVVERYARRTGQTDPTAIQAAQRRAAARLVGAVAERMRLRSPAEAQAFIIAHSDGVDQLELTRLLGAVDDEAASETARDDVQPYLVTVEMQDQATPAPATGTPGNARPTPVPPRSAMHAAIAGQESGDRERGPDGRLITSPAGAQGRMQVMPGTNLDPGYGVTPARDTSDAERSRVGRDYYDALLRHYGGNVTLALTAYNWGPGNVDAHMRAHGDPRTGRVSDSAWLATIPNQEAQNYATSVLRRVGTRPSTSASSPSAQAPTYQGQEINLAATVNRIESDPELTYAQKQALIRAAGEMHSLGNQARAEADARLADLGYTAMNALGENYRSYDQLPLTVRQQLAANPRLEYQFRAIAQTNEEAHQRELAAQNTPTAGSEQFFDLLEASQGGPQDRQLFLRQDLRSPRLNITHGERASLIRLQGEYRRHNEGDATRLAPNIDRIRTYVRRVAGPGTGLAPVGHRANEVQNRNLILLTQRVAERVAVAQTASSRQVTDEELQQIIASEVRPVDVVTQGQVWGESRTQVPSYLSRPTAQRNAGRYVRSEIAPPEGVPRAAAQAIVNAYRAENNGAWPTDEQILELYARAQGGR